MQNKIFIDLDGTLIDNDNKMSIEDVLAIKDALDDKYEIYFSSGRPLSFIDWMIDKVDNRIKAVAFNGMYFPGYYEHHLKESDVLKIMSLTNQFILKTLDGYYVNEEKYPDVFNYSYLSNYPRVEFKNFDTSKCKKILIYEYSKKLSDELQKMKGLNVVEYLNRGFEISIKGIDKGYAITHIKEKEESNIFSIGNDVNDIPMFNHSDHYFVVGEAVNGNKVKNVSEAIKKIRRITNETY